MYLLALSSLPKYGRKEASKKMVNAGLKRRRPGPMSRALGAYKASPVLQGGQTAPLMATGFLGNLPTSLPRRGFLLCLLLLSCSALLTGSQIQDFIVADKFQVYLQQPAEGGEHEKGLSRFQMAQGGPACDPGKPCPHPGFWGLSTAAALRLKWQDVP